MSDRDFKPENARQGRKPSELPSCRQRLSVDDDDDQDSGKRHQHGARPGHGEGLGRPAKDKHLTTPLDAKLRELAELRGIDINAAVSVALAEDWRRSSGPHHGNPDI